MLSLKDDLFPSAVLAPNILFSIIKAANTVHSCLDRFYRVHVLFPACKLIPRPSSADSIVGCGLDFFFFFITPLSLQARVLQSSLWTPKCHWSHLPRDHPSLKRLLSQRWVLMIGKAQKHRRSLTKLSAFICAAVVCPLRSTHTPWRLPLCCHLFLGISCHYSQFTALTWRGVPSLPLKPSTLFFLKVVIIRGRHHPELNLRG